MRLRNGFKFCMVLVVSGFLTLAGISRSDAVSFTGLGDLEGGIFRSVANDISGDGSVIVGNSSSISGAEAFRWTSGGGMIGLGDLAGGGFFSFADGVQAMARWLWEEAVRPRVLKRLFGIAPTECKASQAFSPAAA